MAKLGVQAIRDLARSIIGSSPGGIRYGALVAEIHQRNPETPENTIMGSVWDLDARFPDEITKPSRGLYTRLDDSANEAVVVGSPEQIAPTGIKVKESEFYDPFAEWLKNELGEVTSVIALGGAGLRSKWATPDVVGTVKPLAK